MAEASSEFLDSLMDTELYSIGAYFCDEHPELVDEVVARSEEIERRGLNSYSQASDMPVETLLSSSQTIFSPTKARMMPSP